MSWAGTIRRNCDRQTLPSSSSGDFAIVFFYCLRFSQLSVVDPDYLNPGLDAGLMLKFSSDIDTPLFCY